MTQGDTLILDKRKWGRNDGTHVHVVPEDKKKERKKECLRTPG